MFLQFRWTLYVSLRKSHGCWIGLITATATNGLGVIGGDTVNLVGLGGCLPESAPVMSLLLDTHFILHYRLYGRPAWILRSWSIAKPDYVARYLHRRVSHSSFLNTRQIAIKLTIPFTSFSIITVVLMMYRVRGAILIGILLTSIISWPRGTPVTYFPHTDAGDALFDYFKKVVTFHKLQKIGNAIDVSLITNIFKSRDLNDIIFPVPLWARICQLR